MSNAYSSVTLSTHYVIIQEESGELVSPVHDVDGWWEYREIALPSGNELVMETFDNIALFNSAEEAEAVAVKLREDGDTYTVMEVSRKRAEYFVLA